MQTDETGLRQRWRHLPNAISLARIAAAPVLLATVFLHHVNFFRWLLLACLLSDILDGLIARSLHLTSKLGATLDSVADILTMLNGLLGVAVFQRAFVDHNGGYGAAIAFILMVVVLALTAVQFKLQKRWVHYG